MNYRELGGRSVENDTSRHSLCARIVSLFYFWRLGSKLAHRNQRSDIKTRHFADIGINVTPANFASFYFCRGQKKEYFVHKFETDTPVCIPGMLYKVNLTDEFSGGLFRRNDRWYSIGSEDDGPPSNGHFRVCGSSVKTAAIEKEDPQNNTNNKRKEWKEKGKKNRFQ